MSELQVAGMSVVKVMPSLPKPDAPKTPLPPKRLTFKIPRKTTVGEFKKLLQVQLQQVAGMGDGVEIEVESDM
jgi:hypothetical protein